MVRIPKNYQGNHLTVRKLGPMLSNLLDNLTTHEVSGVGELKGVWESIVGPEMARLTQVISFSQGLLFVEVKSATLYALLSRREKPRILGTVKKRFPGLRVKDIVFRVGSAV